MRNIFENYIKSISSKFAHEETSEMGYRTDFEILLKGIFESINVRRIDHDAKAKQGNKPDFVVLNNDVPILYIEAKDIGVSLDKVEKSEQMARYFGYANLVLTDYVEFRFYRNGLPYSTPIKLADYDIKHRKIVAIPEHYEHAAKTLLHFTQSHKEPIRSGEHLSKIMGGKAQRIRDNVKQFLSNNSEKNTEILRVFDTIRKLLVHDLSQESFADMYAQTLVYGLFVARYHDATPENFTRQEARDLVPASNPLLRHFFDHIVGPNFDKRLEYIVNELCSVFSHADVPELMKQYFKDDLWGKTHEGPDPVIHFYEDFLKEYDPGLRKKMGAFYTPLPVVRFIVRSVDYLLEKDFGLASGLADTSKTAAGIHRVQILDPAVGTGTFISAAIRIIYERLLKDGQKGRWTTYVHNDLLPRLHGFELMMAPYTIAHLKLSMAFKETGFKYFNRRLGIYLTNSLEEGATKADLFTGFGFAESIADESKEAAAIKSKTPIMVVIGNPPYSVSSSNKGEWILNLIKDYKKNLNERKINLDDDYIKFIRFAEHFIEKNKSGIVAMITNNSFIDGITHRQMRKHLLETFDDIYILDLHGNSKKKEKAPDLPAPRSGLFWVYVLKCKDESFYIGQTDNIKRRFDEHLKGEVSWTKSRLPIEIIHLEELSSREESVKREQNLKTGFGRKWLKREYEAGRLMARQAGGGKDVNVFDIQQGVAISIFVRKVGIKKNLGTVHHAELFGVREHKFKTLAESNLQNIKWKKLDYSEPSYFFVPKDFGLEEEYKKGFDLSDLCGSNSSGIETQNDAGNIFFDKQNAIDILDDFKNLIESEIRNKYSFKDGRDWKVQSAKHDLMKNAVLINKIQYRPFDSRFTNYTGITKGIMAYPRFEVMKNIINENMGLIFKRGFDEEKSAPIFLSKCIIDRRSWSRAGMQGAEVIAPLYVYLDDGSKIPNLKKEIVAEIEKIVGTVNPEDIFDYIYAVLHSSSYREKYKEFLKIDFPRVPFPKDAKSFKKLVALGSELRLLHLLESPKVNKFITTYPIAGSDTVEKLAYKDGPSTSSGRRNVFINKDQYFGNVPESTWNFYIGGYQPAQKWLKDRKSRTLTNADIEHYQKIIVALAETERVMSEIDGMPQ